MKIFVKAFTDVKWGDREYCLYREGQYQQPIAMLSGHELNHLAVEIEEAMNAKPTTPGKAAKSKT